MSIEFKKTVAVCTDECSIEEAETLLTWLLDHPKGKVNLKQCEQLHTAIVQVLMALKPSISAEPENPSLEKVLQACQIIEVHS